MTDLTPERLAELRRIAEAATPGPWRVNKYGSIGAGELGIDPVIANVEPFWSKEEREKYGDHGDNARHIATFDPPTVLALLDEIERLEHEVMHLRDFLAESEAKASRLRQRYEILRAAVKGVVKRVDAAEHEAYLASLVDYNQYHAGRENAFERTGEWLREVLAEHGGDDERV
mgnify:CR=1 FL=1